MTITEIVKDNRVRLMFYQKGELWYEVIKPIVMDGRLTQSLILNGAKFESIFQFPVPISDCGDTAFPAEDKAIMFMRWINPHMKKLEKEKIVLEELKRKALLLK